MPRKNSDADAPLHPVRDGLGFLAAVAGAVAWAFRPFRPAPKPGAAASGDAEPVDLDLKDTLPEVIPFPNKD